MILNINNSIKFHQNYKINFNRSRYSNLAPLSCDIVSFSGKARKPKLEEIDIKTCSTTELLDALKYRYRVDEDGMLILDEYRQPGGNLSFEDIGVDENRLFKDIKAIKGNADFSGSNATNLGNLKRIRGGANFSFSKIEDIGKLESIGGNAYFNHSPITDLKNLQNIGGSAYFSNSQITNLGVLQRIGGDAVFDNSQVTDLGVLQNIAGIIYIGSSKLSENDFKGIKVGEKIGRN